MKKLISMIALAAITAGSVYAAPMQQQQDTTKMKKKMKSDDGKMKMKMKGDTTKWKMKKDSIR